MVLRKHMNLAEAGRDDVVTDTQTQDLYADELHTRWKDFVQRVRIHEMLKCMNAQHNKLKVLREHTELDEIIIAKHRAEEELKEVLAEVEASNNDEEGTVQEEHHEHEHDHDPDEELPEGKEAEKDFDTLEEERIRDEMEKERDEILNKGIDILFLRTQAEEEEAIAQIYPPLKRVLADPNYVAKCAVRMFRTRPNITEEEFNAIIELCDDRLEKQALRDAYEEIKNRDRYLHNADERRKMLYEFINSRFFVQFMLITIIVSIVGIFLLTFESIYITYAYPLIVLDNCIIGIFVVEATFKITIYKEDYFKKPWNLLDILIILVNFVEVTVELITKTLALSTDINANLYFKVLKSLRALRLLRVIKFLPNLQVIVTTVFQSMLSMGSIAVLMSLFIFVFAVMGRGLFSEDAPNNFGGLWLSFVTLFQLLTLDDWFELLQRMRQGETQYWIMFIYLFFYIIIENFVFLNLFVAVLVDNFQLTLAATEIRKQKEALIYLEEKENFGEMFEELDTKAVATDEGDNERFGSTYVDPRNPEMTVPDYFPISENTREKVLMEHVFKDLCALDFERFLWNRRLSIVHTIMDKAITVHRNSWTVQDNHDVVELGHLGHVHASST
ncbi:Cation channel sperm-associated protein 1 [Orchesella cincta]|uniref:Cation channel sperm-associated protein 1 n=1 Tax=Orchesella cincta TaxID=48709 RepID=A0A1D2NH01_ORCCI|nr:Cation channel sperm-associated protein 1 [Orchesella cincta]